MVKGDPVRWIRGTATDPFVVESQDILGLGATGGEPGQLGQPENIWGHWLELSPHTLTSDPWSARLLLLVSGQTEPVRLRQPDSLTA